MDALGAEYVAADQLVQRAEGGGARADVIGQCRDVEGDAFAGIARALPVERLVLAELGVKDHRQKARPDVTAWNDMALRQAQEAPAAG
jgi:hypothetical protein